MPLDIQQNLKWLNKNNMKKNLYILLILAPLLSCNNQSNNYGVDLIGGWSLEVEETNE